MGFNDDEAAGRKHAAKNAVQEWAIQDETTGEYLGAHSKPVAAKDALRFSQYASGFSRTWLSVNDDKFRETARIVPAPPREMTDAECWAWLSGERGKIDGWGYADDRKWRCYTGSSGDSYGDTPCDAIRAARKALEKK